MKPLHRILIAQHDAALMAARAMKLVAQASQAPGSLVARLQLGIATESQRGAARQYKKARALMGLESHK